MSDITSGIFKHENIRSNQAEICVLSDVHIANDAAEKLKARNDYVFSDEGEPLSAEAYMLDVLCKKITVSGNRGLFNDGKHVLVFLGDIINGECGYFNCYNSYAYKHLLESIKPWLHTGNIVYVAGNHDKEAKFYRSMVKFPSKSIIETVEASTRTDKIFSKWGIILEHGHKFDCLCTGKTLLGLMGDFASNIVVNLCSPELEDFLRGRGYYNTHSDENNILTIPQGTVISKMNSECRRVANNALGFLSKHRNEYHTIICGHTHQDPVTIQVEDKGCILTYINTGKFAKNGYLNILTENRRGNWCLVSSN